MIWCIENITVNNTLAHNPVFIQSISGPTYQPQNQETTADLTIRFRDFDGSIGDIQQLEDAMKSSGLVFEDEKFKYNEVLKALQEVYPERFI